MDPTSQATTPLQDNSDQPPTPSASIPCDKVVEALLPSFKLIGDRTADKNTASNLYTIIKALNIPIEDNETHLDMYRKLFPEGRLLRGARLTSISDIQESDKLGCTGDITINSEGARKDDPKYIFIRWMQTRGGRSTTTSESESVVDDNHPIRLVWPDKALFDNHRCAL